MNKQTAQTWAMDGGYCFANPWPHTDCIVWDSTKWVWGVGSTKSGDYVPSTIDENSQWGHSDQHTDSPPRT